MTFRYRQRSSGKSWDAESVRALRKHLKRTQQEIAGDLGVRQQTISEWETGMYEPRGASRTLLNIIAERGGFKYATAPVEAEQEDSV